MTPNNRLYDRKFSDLIVLSRGERAKVEALLGELSELDRTTVRHGPVTDEERARLDRDRRSYRHVAGLVVAALMGPVQRHLAAAGGGLNRERIHTMSCLFAGELVAELGLSRFGPAGILLEPPGEGAA